MSLPVVITGTARSIRIVPGQWTHSIRQESIIFSATQETSKSNSKICAKRPTRLPRVTHFASLSSAMSLMPRQSTALPYRVHCKVIWGFQASDENNFGRTPFGLKTAEKSETPQVYRSWPSWSLVAWPRWNIIEGDTKSIVPRNSRALCMSKWHAACVSIMVFVRPDDLTSPQDGEHKEIQGVQSSVI